MGSLGAYLKEQREARRLSVDELAQTTRIPARILRQIETDTHAELPADVFVRGFLRAYARALGLDPEHVLARYVGRSAPPPAPAFPAVRTPEPGRRFGIAIALVILLILFTLALSIVLRPRHRDAPLELSVYSDGVPCALASNTPRASSCAASTTATPIASSRC
jgi:cytoskeletal protein RodZ